MPDVKRNNGRERARQALEKHRTRTPEEVRRAEDTVGRLVDDTDVGLQKLMAPRALAAVAVGLFGGTFVVVAVFSVVGALLFGNGFRVSAACGASLVNRKGQPISRVRALARAAIVPGADRRDRLRAEGRAGDPGCLAPVDCAGGRAAGDLHRGRCLGDGATVARHSGSNRRNLDRPTLK